MSERGFVDERRRKQISTLSNPRNSILGPRNQCSDSRLGPSDLVALGGQAIPADPDRPADVCSSAFASSSEQTEKLVTFLGAPAVVIELRH